MLPQTPIENLSPNERLDLVRFIFKTLIYEKRGDRAWDIFDLRYNFFSAEQSTFEEIGAHFNIKRQRVHQIQGDNLTYIKKVLLKNYTGLKHYSLQAEWIAFLCLVHARVGELVQKPCLESNFFDRLAQEFGIKQKHAFFNLSFDLHEIRRIQPNSGIDPICVRVLSKSVTDQISNSVSSIDSILTRQTSLPLSDMELLSQIVKSKRVKGLTSGKLMEMIVLCSSVEIRADGKIWGKFKDLSRNNQIERILYEAGHTLSAKEIYRQLSQRLIQEGEKIPDDRSLFNQLSLDTRFVSIGKGGWKLAIWTNIEEGSIVEFMIRCLQEAGTPLSAAEIEQYVLARRSVGESSVRSLLNRPEFKKMGADLWGLKEWKSDKNMIVWSPEEVADFVAKYFRQRKLDQVDYADIRIAITSAANIKPQQANGLLLHSPVIKTFKDEKTGRRISVFQPDYIENMGKAHQRVAAGRVTFESKLRDETILFLRSHPGKEAPMNDLITRLMQVYEKPYHTIHTYLSRMEKADIIEKISTPAAITIRLKRKFSTASFPPIEKIALKERRDWVTDALNYINPAEIDKGLFELSKAFENTLKSYLVLALSSGKLTSTNLLISKKDEWKLATIVDFFWAEKLITDKGAFQFLRQERNDRAHGSRITTEELNMLWLGAENFAGMYIQAIQIFDDLENKIKRSIL